MIASAVNAPTTINGTSNSHGVAKMANALGTLDWLHGQLSGSGTRKLAERAFNVFDDPACERLATSSVGNL